MLRRFNKDDGYCVFFIRLSRRDRLLLHSYGRSRRRDGFIKQEGSKKQRSPLLSPPKKALCVCRFLSKNEKKCRQKSVEEFVNKTRTKKHAHQIGDGDDERTKERGSSSRTWSSRLFFLSFAFFPSARGKREISRGASRISTSTTDAAGN